MKIIVLGGGIAGLATSAFLAKQGKHVVVIEKSNSFEDQGAGIQITPNAEKVIKQLGVYDQFKEISDQPSSINIREIDTTRTLYSVPLDQYCMSEFTGDYHHIHRQDLIKLLSVRSKELGVEIIENEKITKIEELDKEVIVSSESGNSYQADFLIAADGLNSIARKYLFPTYAPKFRNFSAWRSLIKIDKDIDKIFLEPNLFISKNLHFVTYPIRKMSYLNCVLIAKDIDFGPIKTPSQFRSLTKKMENETQSDNDSPKNLIIFIRDQVKPTDLWFPRGWDDKNMPTQTKAAVRPILKYKTAKTPNKVEIPFPPLKRKKTEKT